jgi:hypothetical protein
MALRHGVLSLGGVIQAWLRCLAALLAGGENAKSQIGLPLAKHLFGGVPSAAWRFP